MQIKFKTIKVMEAIFYVPTVNIIINILLIKTFLNIIQNKIELNINFQFLAFSF